MRFRYEARCLGRATWPLLLVALAAPQALAPATAARVVVVSQVPRRFATPARFPLPLGATVDRTANRIVLRRGVSRLTVLSGPADDMMSFRIAGLTNPEIVLPRGATVVLTVINVDGDMRHDLVLTAHPPPFAPAPVLDAHAVTMPLLPPHRVGAAFEARVLTVRAARAGVAYYLCAAQGHARSGMFGKFTVTR